jgi:hypothetical protein
MAEILFEQVEELAKNLSHREKVKLIKSLSDMIEQEYEEAQPQKPRRVWYGMCADLGPAPSEEDIAEARREMWGNFPREDI